MAFTLDRFQVSLGPNFMKQELFLNVPVTLKTSITLVAGGYCAHWLAFSTICTRIFPVKGNAALFPLEFEGSTGATCLNGVFFAACLYSNSLYSTRASLQVHVLDIVTSHHETAGRKEINSPSAVLQVVLFKHMTTKCSLCVKSYGAPKLAS